MCWVYRVQTFNVNFHHQCITIKFQRWQGTPRARRRHLTAMSSSVLDPASPTSFCPASFVCAHLYLFVPHHRSLHPHAPTEPAQGEDTTMYSKH